MNKVGNEGSNIKTQRSWFWSVILTFTLICYSLWFISSIDFNDYLFFLFFESECLFSFMCLICWLFIVIHWSLLIVQCEVYLFYLLIGVFFNNIPINCKDHRCCKCSISICVCKLAHLCDNKLHFYKSIKKNLQNGLLPCSSENYRFIVGLSCRCLLFFSFFFWGLRFAICIIVFFLSLLNHFTHWKSMCRNGEVAIVSL